MNIPWAALKTALLILLIVLSLSGMGVWWSANILAQSEAARMQQNRVNDAAKQKLQRSHTEKQLIEQHRDAYQTLIARGLSARKIVLPGSKQCNRPTAMRIYMDSTIVWNHAAWCSYPGWACPWVSR